MQFRLERKTVTQKRVLFTSMVSYIYIYSISIAVFTSLIQNNKSIQNFCHVITEFIPVTLATVKLHAVFYH